MEIIYPWIFLLGASVASFLNASLYRIDNKYKYPDIIKSGSHCEKCGHVLKWWELIPILGYILIRGKCTECKEPINIYYPISELFLGSVFLLFYIFSIYYYLWIVILFLFILSYFDVKDKEIYKNLVHVFLGVSFLFFLLYTFELSNIYLPLIFAGIFLILNIFKKSFGLGDILILLGLGILISWQQYLILFWLGILVALLYSLILVLKDNADIKKTKVPMIPFFTISFTLAILYGEEIYGLLLKLMGIW